MNTVLIIQARMSSSRLPGKVLNRLGDRTVLGHVLSRALVVPGVDAVCCATVDTPDCNPVVEEAERYGVEVFRGSEKDVLDRYHKAALALGADVVMRITSDCPVIDPAVCGEVLALRRAHAADYATNNMPPSWPHGLDCEVFTFDWLDRAAREAVKPSEREHVSPFIRTHPDATRVNLSGPGQPYDTYRWTLDTPRDMEFFEALVDAAPDNVLPLAWRDIAAIVAQYPELVAINAGQDRFEGLRRSWSHDRRAETSNARSR